MDETRYQFVGDGDGVGGLPQNVSQAEADALGVGDVLTAAIANGNYQVVAQAKKKGPAAAPAASGDQPPAVEETVAKE